jgi:DNA repair ATPase RecN
MVEQNDLFLEQMKSIEHLHLFSRRAAQQFFERLSFNYLEFKPALFAYDMYLVASREPLVKRSPEEIEASLLASTSGRLVQALLDQTATLQQLQASHQELVAFYQASESDRADRLQVIENQGQDLVKLSSAIHHTQMVMNQYRTQLDSALEQLHRVDSELQQAYVHLEYSQAQLQFQQNELAQTQIQLKKSQTVVERKDFRLKNLKAKLESSQLEIRTMKSSKFWKLRDQWIKLKARFDSTAVSGK